jgi:D-beta-D-heptose 7-phosphate kinase/D-beta-D-heptose 1-phosphate adenosyltransferase
MANVFLNGCFDVLQVGHINLLLHARHLAGYGKVYVALDEDILVMANKGLQRPIFTVEERAQALLDLRYGQHPIVDEIEFFRTNQMLENIIRRIKPDILLKGSDWRDRKVVGQEYVRQVVFFERQNYSSTEIIRRIMEKNNILK